MAKINTVQKSRKEKVCGRCGNVIPVGSKYYFVDFYSGRTIVRCENCGVKQSETTENPYYSEVYRIQEDWGDRLDSLDSDDFDSGIKDELVEELENLKEELQERFDNIPEQLQDGEAGSLLQERIDSLESVISDIENEEIEEFDEWRDNNGYDEDSFEDWVRDRDSYDEDVYDSELDWLESHREDFDEDAREGFQDYLDAWASNLKDYLSNIE